MSTAQEETELTIEEQRFEDVKERFFEVCEGVTAKTQLSQDEADRLLSLLQSDWYRRASSIVYRLVKIKADQIMSLDLSKDNSLVRAAQLQGEARGVVHAFAGLFDVVEMTRERTDDVD